MECLEINYVGVFKFGRSDYGVSRSEEPYRVGRFGYPAGYGVEPNSGAIARGMNLVALPGELDAC